MVHGVCWLLVLFSCVGIFFVVGFVGLYWLFVVAVLFALGLGFPVVDFVSVSGLVVYCWCSGWCCWLLILVGD